MQADFDVADFDGSKKSELDKQLLVKFFYKTRPDSSASIKEGRPMFKEVEYIDIKIAGDRNGGVCRAARVGDKSRFPEHYRAFKNRVEAPQTGTALSEWAMIPRTIVEQLSFMHVKTVEQLAGLSDNHAAALHGGYGFKAKAKKYLEDTRENKDVSELVKMNEELRESVKVLQGEIDKIKENAQASKPKTGHKMSEATKKKMAAGRKKAAAKKKAAKK